MSLQSFAWMAICLGVLSFGSCNGKVTLMALSKSVKQGQRLEMYCFATFDNSTDVDQIHITKEGPDDDLNLANERYVQTNITAETFGIVYLSVINATIADAGNYKCNKIAVDSAKSEDSNEIMIKITDKKEDSLPALSFINHGVQDDNETIVLTCISTIIGASFGPKWFANTLKNLDQNVTTFNDSSVQMVTMKSKFSEKVSSFMCQVTHDEITMSCNFNIPVVMHTQVQNQNKIQFTVLQNSVLVEFNCSSSAGTIALVSEGTSTWEFTYNESFKTNLNFSVTCHATNELAVSSVTFRFLYTAEYVMLLILIYTSVSAAVCIIVLICCCKKYARIRKLRHIYATFNASLSGTDTGLSGRDLSRRPTRSLPPIPSDKPTDDTVHYANAHLRLSQNSMPARLRHSMYSFSSDSMVMHHNHRNSLPLHASNVAAQNALYFFTKPEDEPLQKPTTQASTFPYNHKPTPPKGLFKHHTLNARSSTLIHSKIRASDYQNWFQSFKISTSCPSIDTIDEGKEVTDALKSMVKLRNKVERRKRRSLIRSRLPSIASKDREQTLPRRNLPSLSRPISACMLHPENPYIERGGTLPSCNSN